ncbi:hypothetical protein [Burkholderia gladioli]|uniref:hypothetical protein n=1 Tax=Burkholderia gladioli TaxID=28095 RepID=UPI0016403670|nr:hypothetical protein [Burkholderia gladioli]
MSKHYSSNKDFNEAIAGLVQDAGWQYRPPGKSKHAKVIAPNGRKMTVPFSPGDWRAVRNFRREVARLSALPPTKPSDLTAEATKH